MRRNLEICLDDRLADDETAIMMLLCPVAPVDLSGAKFRDPRLRLTGRAEGSEVEVLLAAFVEGINTIDNITTHVESPKKN
ncbi:MAG TPA: hypothetical protein VKS79_01520 [Gemmataceae bacterium]|nr:hypothetical protein [Gemmataceae bacterium]